MSPHWHYLLLLVACLVITLPLEFVLRARVYRRWRIAALSILPVLLLFSLWDLVGIARGHWWYAPGRITGLHLPGSMPIEELCFFLVIPLCGLLTYEAVGFVLGLLTRRPAALGELGGSRRGSKRQEEH